MKNQIYPCLWFDGKAKDAAEFYCSVFDNMVITNENPIVVTIESAGQKFMLLNGGPQFVINPSVSFFVLYENREELDKIWEKLEKGGSVLMALDKYDWSERYGWLQDRFGVSWQLYLGNRKDAGQKVVPSLMFTGQQAGKAEKAIQFYTSVFADSSITGILKYMPGDGDVEGTVKHAQFNLNQMTFMAMDSSFPHSFGFNEAVSFVVECETQEEIDYYWEKLSAVPEAEQCGWLKDRFGISWQIIPSILEKLMSDPSRSQRVVDAFLQMKKFEIDKLLNA
ncbi:MAG: VOC family protein [Prolixibacteraceae bacterium]|jgi:predicted 3-demethylubiquinone-9 3-methyltransferase (glyoxalase superfamily)|nr:VOC family protein [Prolixibacteraceae bacterium]